MVRMIKAFLLALLFLMVPAVVYAQTPTPSFGCPVGTPVPGSQINPNWYLMCPQCLVTPTVSGGWAIPTFTVPTYSACLKGEYKSINYWSGSIQAGQVSISNPTKFKLDPTASGFSFYLDGDSVGSASVKVKCDDNTEYTGNVTITNNEGTLNYTSGYQGKICHLEEFKFTSGSSSIISLGGVELMEDCSISPGTMTQIIQTPTPAVTSTPQVGYFTIPYPSQPIVVPNEPHWPSYGIYHYDAPACPAGSSLKGVFANFNNGGSDTAFRILWNGEGDSTNYCPGNQASCSTRVDFGYLWDLTGGVTQGLEDYIESVEGVGQVDAHWAYNESYWHDKIGIKSWGSTSIEISDYYSICYGNIPQSQTPTPTPTPTPTSTPEPGVCGSYQYVNNNPVININPNEWNTSGMIINGDCFTIIPAFGFDLPAYGTYPVTHIGWGSVRICPKYVKLPSIQLLDIDIPMDLLLLPLAMFLIGLISRL